MTVMFLEEARVWRDQFRVEIIILSRKDEGKMDLQALEKLSEGEAFRSKMEERGCPG